MAIKEEQGLSTAKDKARAALIGAAVGDALGWPQESRGGRVGRRVTYSPDLDFQRWTRRAGGRFLSHEESINAGEYSDDTQLLLATGRSILKGRSWLQHLVQYELPAWLVYERGGGGATKRAADAWTSGVEPWIGQNEGARSAYLQAGGNGVAMRILPHVLTIRPEAEFREVSELIFLNGIATHGHPRALVGAIVYGFACWKALNQSGTLAYGHLLEIAMKQVGEWGPMPNCDTPDGWIHDSERGEYERVWSNTVQEMLDLLSIGLEGINAGALAVDAAIMKQLGAVDSPMFGSGTVSAAAAVYLASRYAPDPRHGVLEAAFTKGADTDTLASMAGGLLGMIAGSDWLYGSGRSIQDRDYIQRMADELQISRCVSPDLTNLPRKRSTDVRGFWKSLQSAGEGSKVLIPDSRQATLERVEDLQVKSRSIRGSIWKLRISDGQTIHAKKLEKVSQKKEGQIELPVGVPQTHQAFRSTVEAIKIRVSDLDRALFFYCRILGLAVSRQSKNAINLGGKLTFVNSDYLGENSQILIPSIICIETPSLNEARRRLLEAGSRSVSEVTLKGGLPYFTCKDFDGNVVEVFQKNQGPTEI